MNITKNKNWLISIFIGVFIFFLSSVPSFAGFGVSPTDISYENLKPGATFTKTFTISRSGDLNEMQISVEPDLNTIDSWFTYSPGKTFAFPQGQSTTQFEITVDVPDNTPYESYSGVIRLIATPTDQEVRGVTITQGVRLDAGLVVTESDIRDLTITAISIQDSTLNEPITLEITGENQGNVDASPTVHVNIMDLQMNVLEQHDIANFGFIKPNEKDTLYAQFETNLPTGEYFIEVHVLLDGEELREDRLVFQINNIPSDENEQDDTKSIGFISDIKDFFVKNWTYVASIGVASVFEISTYTLISSIWTKGLRIKGKNIPPKNKKKWWKLLFGSMESTRMALSFGLGFIVFVVMSSLLNTKDIKRIEFAELTNDTQSVQGVKDTVLDDPILKVFPPIELDKYLVYEYPNNTSSVIYEAAENEKFDVIEENEDWYKILLPNNKLGWLQKSIVKSAVTADF